MNNTGIILTMAYPETIVTVSEEWFSPYLRFIGVGKKNYVRAGHAALVLINKETGILEYHDFGRYITPEPNGRVRGKDTDNELDFPLTAKVEDNEVKNLNEILEFLGTHPKLTHGEGKLIVSVCDEVNYDLAREHITMMQRRDFIRYAAFIKNACNCARFVTDSLIASITNKKIRRQLIKSKYFTPSTIGNVVIADTQNQVFEVNEDGKITNYQSTVSRDNRLYFLDRLKNHIPTFVGTLEPKSVIGLNGNAQWLSGIAAGAWFELDKTENSLEYMYKRVSPHGNVDVHATYKVDDDNFNFYEDYRFIHYSNCKFFHIEQDGRVYRFEKQEKLI